MHDEEEVLMGIETGFCHFCQYETETAPYACYESDISSGKPIFVGNIYLCELCAHTSKNQRKDKSLRVINWGLNHIISKIREIEKKI